MGKLVLRLSSACLLPQIAGRGRAQTSQFQCPAARSRTTSPGSGPTVVFLHGAFMDRRSWDHQLASFARQFRVVRYDIRPFGESSRPEKAV